MNLLEFKILKNLPSWRLGCVFHVYSTLPLRSLVSTISWSFTSRVHTTKSFTNDRSMSTCTISKPEGSPTARKSICQFKSQWGSGPAVHWPTLRITEFSGLSNNVSMCSQTTAYKGRSCSRSGNAPIATCWLHRRKQIKWLKPILQPCN